jgi:16S rRNA (guanine527-N7)-methyltransferase
MDKNFLIEQAATLGISLTQDQCTAFEMYCTELIAWNSHTNLTAIREPKEIVTKHFLDSLTVLQALPATALRIIDIGSGAGFPGIPLKIMRPDITLTLVDSVGKKVAFLEHIISKLNLTYTTALHTRAEDIGHDTQYREQFDVALGRAVATLNILAEFTLPFVRVGGIVVAQKKHDEPIDAALEAITKLGGECTNTIHISHPDLPARNLIIISKKTPTPALYPRRAGLPNKKPL